VFPEFKNKKVLLTGHTGFKGTWLLQLLHLLEANVVGLSLAPEKETDLYVQINGGALCKSIIGDINDAQLVKLVITEEQPDFIFHLAAQALVRKSYQIPVNTFATNVMGSIHLLEAVRSLAKPCSIVMITTDKVYENKETGLAFNEDDKLGGYDPYSASKAACEIAISAYRNSFFNSDNYAQHHKAITVLRAGNVIGGGDFSDDRIIPDIYNAIIQDRPVVLRNPAAIRPWQHVLEPLFVYLDVAARQSKQPNRYAGAYNIGPDANDVLDVLSVTEIFLQRFGKGTYEIVPQQNAPHEANFLALDNALIKKDFDWQPKLTAQEAISWTADWYADTQSVASVKCLRQIEDFRLKY